MYLPTTRSWKDWKPCGEWVIAKADPRVKKTAGGIHLPDQIVTVERAMEGTARILKVGQDAARAVGFPLEPGMRFCFRGFLKDAFHEFEDEDGCRIFMLKSADILAIIDDEIQMGAFLSERKKETA